jgi:hypothetical protein
MVSRATFVWVCILVVAMANGTLRGLVLQPWLGDGPGRAASCLTLSAAVLYIAMKSINWMKPATATDAWLIGAMWLGLTLAFEFLVGHYVFRTPWNELLADYNLLNGRLWLLVLATTLAAPRLVMMQAPLS